MSNISLYQYSPDLVWQKAADHLIGRLKQSKNKGKSILLFLSGGSVVQIYGQLARMIEKGDFKSDDLVIAQVDERFQPDKRLASSVKRLEAEINKDINAENIGQTGLWEVCMKKKIPYYLVSQEGTLESSAKEYNQIISKLFSQYDFKIAVLGIGKDCHTAGLIPGYEKKWNRQQYAVGYELNRGQNCTAVQFCQQRFKQRITITPFTLGKIDYALAGVVEEEKRQALQNALNPDNKSQLDKYPAAIIQGIKKVDLFTNV